MSPTTRQLLLAGIDASLLAGLEKLLTDDGFDLIDTVPSANEALAVLQRSRYDAVIVGDKLPDQSMLDCVREIRRAHASAALIIVGGATERQLRDDVLAEETDADAYVRAGATVDDVEIAIRQALHRTVFLANDPTALPQ